MDIVAESLSAGVLKTKNVTVNGQRIIDWFESKLSAAVSFVGVFKDINDAPKKNGAVAIVGSKDYIYSEAAGKWQEFGDEGQIGAISQAVDALSSSLSDYVLSSDLSDYYRKSETSSATQLLSALSSLQPAGNYLSVETDPVFRSLSGSFLTAHQSLSSYSSDIQEISSALSAKASKPTTFTAGNLAEFDSQGNLVDSEAKPSDFAVKADLPYAMVTLGEWEFSGVPTPWDITGISYDLGDWTITYLVDGAETDSLSTPGAEDALSLTFAYSDEIHITATRASLPGHLLDRAGNLVVVTGDTTLTLPAANPGYIRDFLVRLSISGSTVPTITFAAPTGETIAYETDGDEFPVPDEVGNWVYSFTENCAAHTFAVSLKKVNVVAQGGS